MVRIIIIIILDADLLIANNIATRPYVCVRPMLEWSMLAVVVVGKAMHLTWFMVHQHA